MVGQVLSLSRERGFGNMFGFPQGGLTILQQCRDCVNATLLLQILGELPSPEQSTKNAGQLLRQLCLKF